MDALVAVAMPLIVLGIFGLLYYLVTYDSDKVELKRQQAKRLQEQEKAKAERLKWEAEHPNWEKEKEELDRILRNL